MLLSAETLLPDPAEGIHGTKSRGRWRRQRKRFISTLTWARASAVTKRASWSFIQCRVELEKNRSNSSKKSISTAL